MNPKPLLRSQRLGRLKSLQCSFGLAAIEVKQRVVKQGHFEAERMSDRSANASASLPIAKALSGYPSNHWASAPMLRAQTPGSCPP